MLFIKVPGFKNILALKSFFKKFITFIIYSIVVVLIIISAINFDIIYSTKEKIMQTSPFETREFAIVLGAGVRGEHLSDALRMRMLKAIELYKMGLVKKILLSGYGTLPYYNETKAMQKYALKSNIPLEDVIADPFGFSTYISLSRAKKIFAIHSAYILTQEFHLSRTVWLANKLEINALGVSTGVLHEEGFYNFREVFARTKDYFLFYFNSCRK